MQLPLTTTSPWSSRFAPRARVPARLAPYLAEALRDPRFAALWTRGGEGRAYAAACLAMSLSRLRRTTASGRRARYEAIVTRRRRELLSELSGAALPESALGILGRCAWAELSGSAWRRLLRIVAGGAVLRVPAGESSLRVVADDLRRALWHAPHVGAVLADALLGIFHGVFAVPPGAKVRLSVREME